MATPTKNRTTQIVARILGLGDSCVADHGRARSYRKFASKFLINPDMAYYFLKNHCDPVVRASVFNVINEV